MAVKLKGLSPEPAGAGGLQTEVARRYNSVLRVGVMLVAVFFVGSYSLMALGAM